MESLYVCLFSNGHIKVGRSLDPNSRIAQHADRVSCMGVELDQSYVTECPDASDARERRLVAQCAQRATARFQSEWFAGLGFDEVCKWAYDSAHSDLDTQELPATVWSQVIGDLRRSGWTHAALSTECNCGAATISRLALAQQSEPTHSMGETLLRLHRAIPS